MLNPILIIDYYLSAPISPLILAISVRFSFVLTLLCILTYCVIHFCIIPPSMFMSVICFVIWAKFFYMHMYFMALNEAL